MFILHITYTVFKAHARTVCKRSKQTLLILFWTLIILIKKKKKSVNHYLSGRCKLAVYFNNVHPSRKVQRPTQSSAEKI